MEDRNARLDEAEEVVIPLETLLSRLDAIERRLAVMERSALRASQASNHAGSGAASVSPQLETKVIEHAAEIKSLREHVRRAEANLESQAEKLGNRFRELSAGIPAGIEKTVALRMQDLLENVEKEVQQGQVIILEHLESTLDSRMAERLTGIEQTLVHQSKSIEILRERTATTDTNLQRLVGAIERLFERQQQTAPVAKAEAAASSAVPEVAAEPNGTAPGPTAAQSEQAKDSGPHPESRPVSSLEQAMRGKSSSTAPTAAPVKEPLFRTSLVNDTDPEARNKPRVPLARTS